MPGTAAARPPDILWIVTDQQSANMMGCAGNPHVRTPNIDWLASRGVRFTNAWCANPVCVPSRYSLFTGLYPSTLGIASNSCAGYTRIPDGLPGDGPGHWLRRAGYDAVYGGKAHIPGMDAAALGFDYFEKDEREILAERCAQYIRDRRPRDKPFALVASLINPHDICLMAINDHERIGAHPENAARLEQNVESRTLAEALRLPEGMPEEIFFDQVCPPLPDNLDPAADEPGAHQAVLAGRPFRLSARERYTDRQWRLHRWAYARLTERMDAQVGAILGALLETGRFDNTVVVFTSDHGDMDASHRMEHKSVLYPEVCRIPLIIKGLSPHRGGRVHGGLSVNGTDLLRTLYDYAEAGRPEYMGGHPGESLREAVENDRPLARRAAIIENVTGVMAADARYTFCWHSYGERPRQFYDRQTNPGCMWNQVDVPSLRGEVERLETAVREHLAAHHPTFVPDGKAE